MGTPVLPLRILLTGHRGFAILGVLIAMLTLGFFGQSLVYMVGTYQDVIGNQLEFNTAFYESQAGLEYGLKKTYAGESSAAGMNFGSGSFAVTEDASTITSVGRSGDAEVTQTIDKPKQKDCVNLDVGHADADDKQLKHIQLSKNCLVQVMVDKVMFSWAPDNGERLKKIRIESDVVFNDPLGAVSGTLIDIADFVLTNPQVKNFNEIRFDTDMEGKTFTMTLVMGDGSWTTVQTFTP